MLRRMQGWTSAWRAGLLGAAVTLGAARDGAAAGGAAPAATNAAPPALVNAARLPFPVGEEITYEIHWGILPVGRVRVVYERTEFQGRSLLAIRSTARTSRLLEKFYPVNDRLESLVDPATFLPVRFTKQLSEGRYWTHEITTFDHARRQAHFESLKSGVQQTYPIDADTRDILSMMYYLRSRPFVVGTKPQYRAAADDKLYDFQVDVQKNEKVKTDHYGTVPCVKLEPLASFQGLFIRKGRAWFWVSRDPRQLAVKLAAEVPVASISLSLDRVSGPGTDTWVAAASGKPAAKPASPQTAPPPGEGRHADKK